MQTVPITQETQTTHLYNEAAKRFGVRHQIVKAIEEMGELSTELSRWLNDDKATASSVQEEIADVSIMMEQLRLFFFPVLVDRKKEEKLKRLERSLVEEIPYDFK